MSSKAQSKAWEVVYAGPPALAELTADQLRDEGVPVFTPDANLKSLDPFATGGGQVFDLRVLVPRERAEQARELLAAARRPAIDDDGAPAAGSVEERETARLAWTIWLWAVAPIVGVYAFRLAPRYFARSAGRPRRERFLVLLALAYAASWCAAIAAGIAIDV
jgi:hypothetical protein